jgi:hypothetical protein
MKSISMVHKSSGIKLGPEDKFVSIMTEKKAKNCHYARFLRMSEENVAVLLICSDETEGETRSVSASQPRNRPLRLSAILRTFVSW